MFHVLPPCLCVKVAPESHWPQMHALILVVSAKKKPVSSTSGMKLSVETSSLLQVREQERKFHRRRMQS